MMKLLLVLAILGLPEATLSTINDLSMYTQAKATLTVDVSGVKERKGKLQVALFNSAEGFPSDAKPFRAEALDITADNALRVVFKDLPAGEYSVAAYHDENGNGKLDKNLLGIPVEDYGFSNDTRGTRMSAPSFEETKLQIAGADATIQVEVR